MAEAGTIPSLPHSDRILSPPNPTSTVYQVLLNNSFSLNLQESGNILNFVVHIFQMQYLKIWLYWPLCLPIHFECLAVLYTLVLTFMFCR